MRFRRKAGEYPNLLARDVLSGGTMTLWRNKANEVFGNQDKWALNEKWDATEDLDETYTRLEAEEKKLGATNVFAWDTDFGYLSPDPLHCGTGLTIEGEFHLEALHLIGDLPPVLNAFDALRFMSSSIVEDGIRQAAHIFRVRNLATLGLSERDLLKRARTLFDDLVQQELNARRALVEDTPRIIADSMTRALAILRHARLLAPGELLDLLSPVLLGTTMGFIDGITRAETIKMMRTQLNAPEIPANSAEDDRKRDARDAALADRINKRFQTVDLNSYAESCLM